MLSETRKTLRLTADLGRAIVGRFKPQSLLGGDYVAIGGAIEAGSLTREDFFRAMDSLADIDGSGVLGSPLAITPDLALRVAVVYRCVAAIGGLLMQCPVRIDEHISKNGKRSTLPVMQDLEHKLNTEPHPLFSGPQMVEYQTSAMLLYGDGFSYIERNGADVTGLRQYHPNGVGIVEYAGGRRLAYRLRSYGYMGQKIQDIDCDQADVIDRQGANHNGYRAESVVRRIGASAVSMHREVEYSSHDYFKSGNQQKLLLRSKGNIDKNQIESILDQWMMQYSMGTRSRNIPVLMGGEDWEAPHNLTITPEDAQMLETRKFAVMEIARLFGVPGILAGVEDGASGWGTGVEMITRNFLRGSLGAIKKRFDAELTRKLPPKGSRITVRLDTTDLLRASSKERGDWNKAALGIGISPGWMSTNEVREAEGLPPLDDAIYDMVKHGKAEDYNPGEDYGRPKEGRGKGKGEGKGGKPVPPNA